MLLLDSTTRKAHPVASGAVDSAAAAEALGHSHGGLCSKLAPPKPFSLLLMA
jgi:hypothetical protein